MFYLVYDWFIIEPYLAMIGSFEPCITMIGSIE